MKPFLLLVLLCATSLFVCAQNYKIGHRQVAWKDASRKNRNVKVDMYYPAAANGDNTALPADGKKYPILVFGHGYQLTYKSYLWVKDSLVPKGYYVAFARTEEELFPDHTTFAKDLAFIVTSVNTDMANSTSWLYNRVLPKYAVGGHSMGGGATLLAAQYSPLITTLVPFAAAETNPSAIAACKKITLPSLIIAGASDCVSPPADNQLPMYNNIIAACKVYALVNNAKHCHWALNNGKCKLGEATICGSSTNYKPTLATTMAMLTPWLNSYLYGAPLTAFNRALTTNNNLTYQKSCSALGTATAPITETKTGTLKLFPVPVKAGGVVTVQLPFTLLKPLLVQVTDQAGLPQQSLQVKQTGINTLQLPTQNLQKGLHFVLLQNEGVSYRGVLVVE